MGALLRPRDPSTIQSLLGGITSRRVDCQRSWSLKLDFVRCRAEAFLVQIMTNLLFMFLAFSLQRSASSNENLQNNDPPKLQPQLELGSGHGNRHLRFSFCVHASLSVRTEQKMRIDHGGTS
jgi:hypothetical protein